MNMLEVNIGDKFDGGAMIGTVDVLHVSTFGQIVYRYDDGSVEVAQNVEEMKNRGLIRETLSCDGWINITRFKNQGNPFFDDSVYETEDEAIEEFDNVGGMYELLDTIKITWGT